MPTLLPVNPDCVVSGISFKIFRSQGLTERGRYSPWQLQLQVTLGSTFCIYDTNDIMFDVLAFVFLLLSCKYLLYNPKWKIIYLKKNLSYIVLFFCQNKEKKIKRKIIHLLLSHDKCNALSYELDEHIQSNTNTNKFYT